MCVFQGDANQNVLLGQRAGDTGRQQVWHGTRARDIVRAGQNVGRRAEHRVLRDVRQRQPQRQGMYLEDTLDVAVRAYFVKTISQG